MYDDNADNDIPSFSQSCHPHPIDTRRQYEKEDDEVPVTSFGSVFLYSPSGSPCWTESESHQSSLDLAHSDLILQGSRDNAADRKSADMTASWSSAATGKPQLSYAERLRMAKEGTAKAETPAPPPTYTAIPPTLQSGIGQNETAQRQQEQRTESPAPANITPRPTPVQSLPGHGAIIKADSTDNSSNKNADTPAAGRPVLNVWDARKKMLQDRERAREDGKKAANGSMLETVKSTKNEVRLDREHGNFSARTAMKVSPTTDKTEEPKEKKKRGADTLAKAKAGSAAVPPSAAESIAWPKSNTPEIPARKSPSKAVAEGPPATSAEYTFPPLGPSTNGTSTTATSPSISNKRLDQRRPSPLPINSQDKVETSRTNDATASSSPLLGVSPRFAQIVLSDRRGSRDHSSSPLRSPSAGSGSVRGPRFTVDTRSSKVAAHMLSDDVDCGSTRAGSSGMALHLSNGTTDGSYAPIRASASLFSPTGRSPNLQDPSPMQRSQSSAPSPRGSRGRGKMSKTSDGHSVGESSGSRIDVEDRGLPNDVPVGPRRQQNGDTTPPRDGGRGGGSYRRGVPYYQPALPYAMYGPPSLPPGGFYNSPPRPFQLESTPSEFAPQGDAAKSEPSEALLHQIEFYFSHRNLEGDFFLRKNMDSQGFVPIHVVANFNKVKKMTDKINIIKETLLFSKVLFVDAERDMVRKALDWHLYTLVDGERPRQNMYQQQPLHLPNQAPPPHFGHPLPPFVPAFPPAHYGHSGSAFHYSSPYNYPAASAFVPVVGQDLHHRPADSPDGHHSNGEASGDNVSHHLELYDGIES